MADEDSAIKKGDLFQEKIDFLKRVEHYEEALEFYDQALSEEIWASDKLELNKQRADLLKRIRS